MSIDPLLAHAAAALACLEHAAGELARCGNYSDKGVDAALLILTTPLRYPKVKRARAHLADARRALDALDAAARAATDPRVGAVHAYWRARGVVGDWIELDAGLPMRTQREALQAIIDDVRDLGDRLRGLKSST
ncbi:MAG TPA: hypothetical protein VM734_32150 [Kofleriaceae bacterium]|nr:hypothetical protein [Kofleriaceae bacterium]